VEHTANRPSTRLAVVLVHGFGEHVGRYRHLAQWLSARQVGVVATDLRGHGHSAGRRSFIESYDDYLHDVSASVQFASKLFVNLPIVIVGHSMGGLIAALFSQTPSHGVAGLALSSPAFGFAVQVPLVKRAAGHLMSRIWPTLALPAGVPSGKLSHDQAVVAAYDADPLVNKVATARWYTASLKAQQDALLGAHRIRIPTLLLCAGNDEVASTSAAQLVFERLGSVQKRIEILEGFYHEIFNELERDKAYTLLGDWLDALSLHAPNGAIWPAAAPS
jgi:lysophospholipase